jgi:transaldolase
VRTPSAVSDRSLPGTSTAPEPASTLLSALTVKMFADGADLATIRALARDPLIKGFTTNPTLMRRAGIGDYRAFARDVLREIGDRPISFEVIGDELPEMERQAREISSWGENVYVKIPPSTTRGQSAEGVICGLVRSGVRLNVTALLTLDQVQHAIEMLRESNSAFISVFAGRVADTGRDPVPLMAAAVELLRPTPHLELIWASPRELLNVFQADAIGCHIVTVTNDILKKLPLVGRNLDEYTLETIRMFIGDAREAGYSL